MFIWRAADKEGEVLDLLVRKRRNKIAALKLQRKLLKNQGFAPDTFVTDGLASYPAAMKALGCQGKHQPSRLRDNNRIENSHLSVSEESDRYNTSSPRAMLNASHLPTRRHGGVECCICYFGVKIRFRASVRPAAVNVTRPTAELPWIARELAVCNKR